MNREPSGNYKDLEINTSSISNIDYPYHVRKTYRHSVNSNKGNLKCTKHSSHRTSNVYIEVTIPRFTIDMFEHKEVFTRVKFAKQWIRKMVPRLKASPLTNISSAANGTGRFKNKQGYAYGLIFKNIYKGSD